MFPHMPTASTKGLRRGSGPEPVRRDESQGTQKPTETQGLVSPPDSESLTESVA